MSVPTPATVTCPRCGQSCQLTIWNTVNGTLDPALRQRVLDNTIHATTCPKCKQELNVTADILYHDMDRKFFISLAQAERPKPFALPDSLLEATGEAMAQHRLRFVTSHNQLVEKIMIFEADLSDFAIEALKLITWRGKLPQKRLTDDSMYFCGVQNEASADASFSFELYENGKPLAKVKVPVRMYSAALEQFGDRFRSNRLGEWIVVNQSSLLTL